MDTPMKTIPLLFIIVSTVAFGQIPRTISYQGLLTNSSGALVADGTYTLTIRLFRQATGGTAVFTETHSASVAKGVYNITIGSVTTLPDSLQFDRPYFLSVAVNSGSQLNPRTPLTAAPYALHAETAETATKLIGAKSLALPFRDTNRAGTTAFSITNIKTGGHVAEFRNENPLNTGPASVYAINASSGPTIESINIGEGKALKLEIANKESGAAVLDASTNGTGNVARLSIDNMESNATLLLANTRGKSGSAAQFAVDLDSNGSPALISWSLSKKPNSVSLYALKGYGSTPPEGGAIFGYCDQQAGIIGMSLHGKGISARSSTNIALYANSNTSTAIYAESEYAPTLILNQREAGDIAVFRQDSVNKARIDQTGKGFFNGGTQNSGADVAEAFAVVGKPSAYEPGDVLVIAPQHTRTVEKSSVPYATNVLGVHAAKPGVLLTERYSDADLSDLVPMGVVGVLLTKVTNEGGPIRAGDLLVTSSTLGHAMKADRAKLGFGMVLGKALESFNGTAGFIQAFINVK